METPRHRVNRQLGRIAIAISVTLAVSAAPAWARGFPTTTTLSSSATAIGASQSAVITATVRPGVLVFPFGVVNFTDATTGAALGTARPGFTCALIFKPCQVGITVPGSSLGPGANAIVGQYAGDRFEAPSQGTVALYQGASTQCTAALDPNGCTATATSADGTAATSISSPTPASGTETVVIAFGTQQIACSTAGTGDLVAFTVSNAGGYKSLGYTVNGAAADAAYAAHPDGSLCYESPDSFTTASGQAATQEANGLYEGILPACTGGGEGDGTAEPASNEPCLDSAVYVPADQSPSGASTFTEVFETCAEDPRASN
jgi:hypothetical protein